MRTETELLECLQRYGHPTKMGRDLICLNDWFLGLLPELLQREEQRLIYDAVIASHGRELYTSEHFGSPIPMTKERIIQIIEAAGSYSEDQGGVYLNGRKVRDLDTILRWGISMLIMRVAFIASGKPEPQPVCYEIVTDKARLPQAMNAILRSLGRALS